MSGLTFIVKYSWNLEFLIELYLEWYGSFLWYFSGEGTFGTLKNGLKNKRTLIFLIAKLTTKHYFRYKFRPFNWFQPSKTAFLLNSKSNLESSRYNAYFTKLLRYIRKSFLWIFNNIELYFNSMKIFVNKNLIFHKCPIIILK